MPGHKDKGAVSEREDIKPAMEMGQCKEHKCKQMLLILCRQHLKQKFLG